jgi:hypothetical protein
MQYAKKGKNIANIEDSVKVSKVSTVTLPPTYHRIRTSGELYQGPAIWLYMEIDFLAENQARLVKHHCPRVDHRRTVPCSEEDSFRA